MVRITIELREELARTAEQRARERGLGLAEYLRAHLEDNLLPGSEQERQASSARDPFFADEAVFVDDGPTDVAEKHDKYLAQAMDEEMERWRHRD